MSSDCLVISDEINLNRLIIKKNDADYWDISIDSPGFDVSSTVYIYTDAPSFLGFIEDVIKNSSGWHGEKEWHSLERDFFIKLRSDSTGHVTITVMLANLERQWSSECTFEVLLSVFPEYKKEFEKNF